MLISPWLGHLNTEYMTVLYGSMKKRGRSYLKWLTPGLGIKRWLVVLLMGITFISLGLAEIVIDLYRHQQLPDILATLMLRSLPNGVRILLAVGVGMSLVAVGLYKLSRSILEPFTGRHALSVVDVVYAHNVRRRGLKVVAIGGGTGLPSILRGMKRHTSNLTAIVTVADDGGSSGRLRRDLGILPPGDLRNNIAALANDEDLMTQLFQYRFGTGDLGGHSFGNLFLTALSSITGSMDRALVEAERVLAIQGSVLPATLDEITLMGEVWHADSAGLRSISGESKITEAGGVIERVFICPPDARAYPKSVQAILAADLIAIGPGSLFTSILPTLLIKGITEAIRASGALCVYVCNVATQPGETDGFDVADHILALERHIGSGLIDVVLANNHFPSLNAGENTHYVRPAPQEYEVTRHYQIVYADLTDVQHPWRHDPTKLAQALQEVYANYQASLLKETA
jgi:uncharacterized cofD-like protein